MHQPYEDYDDDELPRSASAALRHALHHARTREIRLGRLHVAAAGRQRKPHYVIDDDSIEPSPFHTFRQVA